MRTVAELTQTVIKDSPYLEEALALGIINLTSLARKIKPQIEAKNLKKTSEAAIVMALQRLAVKLKKHPLGKLKRVMPQDLTVKSNLVEYVFQLSGNFNHLQEILSHELKGERNVFFSTTQGIFEATVIVSQPMAEKVEKLFKKEKLLLKISGLSAMVLRFSENTIRTAGVYYNILKALAWDNITIAEVISVGSELSLLFESSQIDRAFPVIQQLIR
jgi:hypothetical protein